MSRSRHALVHTTDSARLARWDEVAAGGVLGLMDPAAAASFEETMLRPSEQYGERRNELVHTLRLFLQLHGRTGPLADQLGVHRNTVRNRLLDIERALGRSLDEPATRVNLWIALELEATRKLQAI